LEAIPVMVFHALSKINVQVSCLLISMFYIFNMYIIIVCIGQYQKLIVESFSSLKWDNDNLGGIKRRIVVEVKQIWVKRDKCSSVTTRLRQALEMMTQQVCLPRL